MAALRGLRPGIGVRVNIKTPWSRASRVVTADHHGHQACDYCGGDSLTPGGPAMPHVEVCVGATEIDRILCESCAIDLHGSINAWLELSLKRKLK